jgi:hypothetical protein
LKTRPRFPLGLLELDRDIGSASPYKYVMENEKMKLRIWMIDAGFGIIMAGLIGFAYWIDGPKNQFNAIKPTVTQSEHLLLCLDGMRPVDYQCPDGERL